MKTKLCRPVLVESKKYIEGNVGLHVADNSLQIIQRRNLENKFFDTDDGNPAHGIVIPQQLILISLDPDEKIEVDDLFYSEGRKRVYRCCGVKDNKSRDIEYEGELIINSFPSINNPFVFKVIATQSQLSPEYINQFIEEYNKGEVKDIEIESDYQLGNEEDENQNLIPILRPKLTNGFITIVKKEPILYTEEEVRKLCLKSMTAAIHWVNLYTKNQTVPDLNPEKWFDNNKKK